MDSVLISFVCLLYVSIALPTAWPVLYQGLIHPVLFVVWPWPNFTETEEMYYSLLRRIRMISFVLFPQSSFEANYKF